MNLETGDNPAWNCQIGQYKHLSQVMFQCKDIHLNEEKEEESGSFYFNHFFAISLVIFPSM